MSEWLSIYLSIGFFAMFCWFIATGVFVAQWLGTRYPEDARVAQRALLCIVVPFIWPLAAIVGLGWLLVTLHREAKEAK